MTRLLLFILAALVAAGAAGCDDNENPLLLNPPLPDSARVRVVNLLPTEPADMTVAGTTLATGLPPFQVSGFRPYLFIDRVPVYVRHGGKVDTADAQSLAAGAFITYVVLPAADRSRLVPIQTGTVDSDDLRERQLGRVVLLNAGDDSTSFYLKIGCQSGDTLIRPVPYGGVSSAEVGPTEVSLYLFSDRDSVVLTTAHIHVDHGSVVYLIAAVRNGAPTLYQLDAATVTPGGPLTQAPPETELTASVEVLNAMADGSSLSATLGPSETVATGVGPLDISPAKLIQACIDPRGDSLILNAGSGTFPVPIRFTVGSRVLVVAYRKGATAGAVALSRNTGTADAIYIRVMNASNIAQGASVTFGAGAPAPWQRGGRPFPSLNTGDTTRYYRFGPSITPVSFPLILRAESGFNSVLGGVQPLANGYYTLFIVDQGGAPTMRLLRDDQPGTSLISIADPASNVLFFNMMPDANAQFTAQFKSESLTLPEIAYSYALSTALPAGTTAISSNAGNTTIDLSLGNFTVGATGSGSNRTLLAFQAPPAPLDPARAAVRFLNAIKGSGPINIYVDVVDVANPPKAVVSFGTPTETMPFDARKYSFVVTGSGPTDTLARSTGIELTPGRNYLMVIGPKDPGSNAPHPYATLWIPE